MYVYVCTCMYVTCMYVCTVVETHSGQNRVFCYLYHMTCCCFTVHALLSYSVVEAHSGQSHVFLFLYHLMCCCAANSQRIVIRLHLEALRARLLGLAPLFWHPFLANLVLAPLFWHPFLGNLVLAPLFWQPFFGNLVLESNVPHVPSAALNPQPRKPPQNKEKRR